MPDPVCSFSIGLIHSYHLSVLRSLSFYLSPYYSCRGYTDRTEVWFSWFRGVGLNTEDTFQLNAFSCSTDWVSPFHLSLSLQTPACTGHQSASHQRCHGATGQNYSLLSLYQPSAYLSTLNYEAAPITFTHLNKHSRWNISPLSLITNARYKSHLACDEKNICEYVW